MNRTLTRSVTLASERFGRRSMVALGAAGLAAAAAPGAVTVSKAGKRARKRCRRQVQPCQETILAWVEGVCQADPDPPACIETRGAYADCCAFLGSCNASATLECLYVGD